MITMVMYPKYLNVVVTVVVLGSVSDEAAALLGDQQFEMYTEWKKTQITSLMKTFS